eukprot:GEMP01031623.1.p1 GENE.GEMP01031623.1~~GEMP01031623.1.p1  ORF type:complete len:678 (+),score=160.86 GEMP01031623.1:106-2139(+)
MWCAAARSLKYAQTPHVRQMMATFRSVQRPAVRECLPALSTVPRLYSSRVPAVPSTSSSTYKSTPVTTFSLTTMRSFSSQHKPSTTSTTSEEKKQVQKASDLRTLREFATLMWSSSVTRRQVGTALSCIVVAKGFTVLAPVQLGYLVNHLSTNDVSTLPYWLVASYGISRISTSLFNEIRGFVFARVSQGAVRDVCRSAFASIHGLDLDYMLSMKSGALQSDIQRVMKSIPQVMQALLFNIMPTILEASFVLAVLYCTVGFSSTAVCTATFGLYALFTMTFSNYRRTLMKKLNSTEDVVTGRLLDSVQNFEMIKYFDAAPLEVRRYDDALKQYEDHQVKILRSLCVLNFGQQCIVNGGLMTLMLIATNQVLQGHLQVGDLVAINTLVLQIAQPLNMLGTMYRLTMQGIIDMQKLQKDIDRISKVPVKHDCKQFEYKGCEIQFENVHFEHGPIVNFSATIKPGERVAIVGPSGSGKSTLLKLLFRLYDPSQGRILIDGQDLRDLDPLSFRKYLGIVPQDTILFNDTVLYNVSYSKPNATREEVADACTNAMLHDTISLLPNKYDTIVGDRGASLSGGEKQRIGIARCLLRDAPVLVLDEATSALDMGTERAFNDALQKVGRKTVIVVAHRLSTIQYCDRILYIDGGNIKEQGSHDELMALDGFYRKQFEGGITVPGEG